MDITVSHEWQLPVDALILEARGDQPPNEQPALARLDAALGGALFPLLEREDFRARRFQLLELTPLGRLPAATVVLLGTGPLPRRPAEERILVGQRIGELATTRRWRTLCCAPAFPLAPTGAGVEPLVLGILCGTYRFLHHRTREDGEPLPRAPETLVLSLPPKDGPPERFEPTVRLAAAMAWARDLINEPASVVTPSHLADAAQALADATGLGCELLDASDCARLGLNLLLAVGRGSAEPVRMIHLVHRPTGDVPPPRIGLVGKGITFDAGGLSLKPAASMLDMKADMAGGASVLAILGLLPAFAVPFEVHGLVPACENLPSGTAYRLGDVLRGLSGPSIEVVNTDAEGRLVLADAMAYARALDCSLIVDLATLTGACMVALGEETAGVFANDDDLRQRLVAAAEAAGESVWPLPLLESLEDQLKSPVADVKNSGGRYGGAITAALFLRRFVSGARWAHVDLAGPAHREKARPGRPAGATGFGISTLLHLLCALPPGISPAAGAAPQPGAIDP